MHKDTNDSDNNNDTMNDDNNNMTTNDNDTNDDNTIPNNPPVGKMTTKDTPVSKVKNGSTTQSEAFADTLKWCR